MYFLFTASGPDFVGPVGTLTQGIIVDAFGRKTAILANIVPHIIGWFLIYCNFGVLITILGRVLTGMMTSSMFYAAQLYVVECVTVNHTYLANNFRTWTGLLGSFGGLFTFLLGAYFNYRQVAFTVTILAILVFLIICIFIPESPPWLYLKGRVGDAEMAELKLGIAQSLQQNFNANTRRPSESFLKYTKFNILEAIAKLRRPEVRQAIVTSTTMTILIMSCGGSPLLSYLGTIIYEGPVDIRNTSSIASSNSTDEDIPDSSAFSLSLSIISGSIGILSHLCVTFALPVLGIKILMIGSVMLTCLGWILIGFTSLQMKSHFLHLLGIWITIFGFYSGTLAAPISILSDLFPIDFKGAASIPIISLTLSSAVTTKLYPYIHAIIGGYVYYIYATLCPILASFVYFHLPETVGSTYEQICANLLNHGSRNIL